MHHHIILRPVVLPILIETFHQDWLHTNWGKNMYFFFVEYHLNNIYLIFYIIIFLIEAIFHTFWSTKSLVNIFFWKLNNILYLNFVNLYFSIDNIIKVTIHRLLKNYYRMSLSFFFNNYGHLPSTSPANFAIPYFSMLGYFRILAAK